MCLVTKIQQIQTSKFPVCQHKKCHYWAFYTIKTFPSINLLPFIVYINLFQPKLGTFYDYKPHKMWIILWVFLLSGRLMTYKKWKVLINKERRNACVVFVCYYFILCSWSIMTWSSRKTALKVFTELQNRLSKLISKL